MTPAPAASRKEIRQARQTRAVQFNAKANNTNQQFYQANPGFFLSCLVCTGDKLPGPRASGGLPCSLFSISFARIYFNNWVTFLERASRLSRSDLRDREAGSHVNGPLGPCFRLYEVCTWVLNLPWQRHRGKFEEVNRVRFARLSHVCLRFHAIQLSFACSAETHCFGLGTRLISIDDFHRALVCCSPYFRERAWDMDPAARARLATALRHRRKKLKNELASINR